MSSTSDISVEFCPMNANEHFIYQQFIQEWQWCQSLQRIATGGKIADKTRRIITFLKRYPQRFKNVDESVINVLKVYMYIAKCGGWLHEVPVEQWHPYINPSKSSPERHLTLEDWGDHTKLEQHLLATFNTEGAVTERFDKQAINKSNTPKEENMKAEITHRTEINGTDINEMSHSDLIHTIQNVESKIETLEKIKAESSYVHDEIGRLKKFVTEVVDLLDKK